MNDRLRFRAFHKPTKRMFEVYCFTDEHVFENTLDGVGTSPTNPANIEDCILEQCTGLKDKTGRLIYEGDIVCWTRAQTDGDVDSICPIVFDNDMCSFGPLLNGHSLWMPHQTDLRMKVLGNIHENPELLEDK